MRWLCLAIVTLAGSVAAASATPSSVTRASYRVTLRGVIDQGASYTRHVTQLRCEYVETAQWGDKLVFHSARPTRLVITKRAGRVRFSPSEIRYLAGTVTTFRHSTFAARTPSCENFSIDCHLPATQTIQGVRATIAFRNSVLSFGRTRDPKFFCGNAEHEGSPNADLDLASGRIAGSRLLGPSSRSVSGSFEATSPLAPPSYDNGTLHRRVSWTLKLVPVRR